MSLSILGVIILVVEGGGWCSSGQLSACTLHPPATISRLPAEILCLFRKLKENADSGKDLWFAAVTRKDSGELSSGSFQFCEKKYNSIKSPTHNTAEPFHDDILDTYPLGPLLDRQCIHL